MTARATVLLAHHVNQTASGEMNVLGMGWSVVGPEPLGPHQLIIVLESDEPDWLDYERRYVLRLVDQDEVQVEAPGEDGSAIPVRFSITVTPDDEPVPDREPGLRGCRGALSVGMPVMLPLDAGRYRYELLLDGEDLLGFASFRMQGKAGEAPLGRGATVALEVG